MKNQTVLEQVFVSMRYGRKYSAGFIASRQKLNIGAVRQALRTLEGGGHVRETTILIQQTLQALHIQAARTEAYQ